MTNIQTANTIKLICKQKSISMTQMLKDCEITKSFIYDLEKRNTSPSCDKLSKIADYLDVSVDYLLGRTDKPNGYNNISNIDTTVNGTQANIINNDRNNDNFDEVKNILNHLSTATRFRAIADILDLLEEKYIKSEIEAEPKINITYSKIYADEGGVTKKETPAGLPKISDFFND